VKLKHVKDKELDLKTNAHFKKSNGTVEISIDFKEKIYNDKFIRFLYSCWIQWLGVPHSTIERLINFILCISTTNWNSFQYFAQR